MAFGVANEFEASKMDMGLSPLAQLPENTEKFELTTTFRQQATNWDYKGPSQEIVKAPEVRAADPYIVGEVGTAGSSLRGIDGLTPSSGGVMSGFKEIGMEIGKDVGELGKEIFSLFSSKPEEPAIAPENAQLAQAAPPQRQYTPPLGL
jgi:hypothetical protein